MFTCLWYLDHIILHTVLQKVYNNKSLHSQESLHGFYLVNTRQFYSSKEYTYHKNLALCAITSSV